MKKLLALLLALVMVLGLVACSAKDADAPAEETPETEAPAEEKVEAPAEDVEEETAADLTADLTLWSYPLSDAQEDYFMNTVMPAFNEQYPNITLEVTTIPWDGGPEKVNVAIAAGTTPDLLLDSDMRISGYAAKGVLVPVTDVVTNTSAGVPDAYQHAVTMDGEDYMVSAFHTGGTAMLVNYALAEQYGIADMLPEDHKSWTWDEFRAFCEAATDAGKSDGVYSIGMFAGSQSSDTNTMSWLMAAGTTILNEDKTAVTLNTEDAGKILDNMAALVQDEVALPGATTLIDDEVIELFLGGKTVICQYGDLWTVNQAYDRQQTGEITGPMDAQFYLFPTLDGEAKTYLSYGASGFSIFDNGDEDKIAAAKAFIEFMCSTNYVDEFVELCGKYSCKTDVELYTAKPEVSREVTRMTGFADHQMGNYGSSEAFWSEFRGTFYPEVQAVYSGAKDGITALNDFAANADAVIAKY